MTKKYDKKTPKFQFGTPFEKSRPCGVQAGISVDLKKVLSSLFNMSDLLPSTASMDSGRLKNIIPTMFQRHSNKSTTRTLKTPHFNSNETTKRFYIDINKLKEIKTLNSKEKENFKQILYKLKCENDRENEQIKRRKEQKKIKKRTLVRKKAKSSFSNEKKAKNVKCSNKQKNKTTLKVEKARKSSMISQSRECKQCSESFDITYRGQRRKQRQPQMTMASAAENILQTLIADPRAFGDANNQPIENAGKSSSSSMNTIFRKGQNICIKNIELKYLKPTYVVQYNTNDNIESNDSVEDPYLRQRLYSTATLDAHLGQTPAPDYHEGKPHAANTPMHYKESSLRIIGMGHGTEEMLRERGNSHIVRGSLKREDTKEYVPAGSIELSASQGERVTKWQRDPLPSYLLPTEQRAGSISIQSNEVKNKKEQKGRKCIDFVKKCLCLPTEKKDDKNTLKKVESVTTRVNKEEFLKIRINSPQINNDNARVNRITQDEFFHKKEILSKNKQKLQKKEKVRKVSFE